MYMSGVVDVLLSIVVALVMLVLGLSLRYKDYVVLVRHPWPVVIGLAGQMLILPLVAIGFVTLLPISPAFKVGFVILSVCPGGTTSGMITYLLRGSVALSLSLTVLNSVIALATIPLAVSTCLRVYDLPDVEIVMPVSDMVCRLIVLTILPVVVGMLLGTLWSEACQRIQVPLKRLMLVLLASVFALKFFAAEGQGGAGLEVTEGIGLLPLALGFNVLSFLVAIVWTRTLRLSRVFSLTAAIEMAVQNSSLALLITGTLLKNSDMSKPALVYAMTSFGVTLLLGYLYKSWWRRKGALVS